MGYSAEKKNELQEMIKTSENGSMSCENTMLPIWSDVRRICIMIAMVVILTISLTGCSGFKLKHNFYGSTYDSAEEQMEFLLEAIDNRDVDAIVDKFSPYASDYIDDMEDKIERLIDEFPGCDDYDIKDTFRRHSNYGDITYALTPSYDFSVDDKEYRMRIIYYVQADEDADMLGWYSIQLYQRYNSDYSPDMHTHGVEDEPDILLWDYTVD